MLKKLSAILFVPFCVVGLTFAQETNAAQTNVSSQGQVGESSGLPQTQGKVEESSHLNQIPQETLKHISFYYVGFESYGLSGSTVYIGGEIDFGKTVYFGLGIKLKAFFHNFIPVMGKGAEFNPKLGFALLRPVNTKGFNIQPALGFYLDYYSFSDEYNSILLLTYGPTFDLTFDLMTSKTFGIGLSAELKYDMPDSLIVPGVNLGLNLPI